MTKEQALYGFWSGFGWPAYEESSIPTVGRAPAFPYITYQVVTGSFPQTTYMTASIWGRNAPDHSALPDLSAKTDQISKAITRVGHRLDCDGGAIWLRRGSPFAQIMGDPSDDAVRRMVLNITAEYITND